MSDKANKTQATPGPKLTTAFCDLCLEPGDPKRLVSIVIADSDSMILDQKFSCRPCFAKYVNRGALFEIGEAPNGS